MLNLKERARSTHPELPIGRFLKSKSLGGNQVILGVIWQGRKLGGAN